METDYRRGAVMDSGLEYFARMHDRLIQRANGYGFFCNHLVFAIQVQRNEMLPVKSVHAAERIEYHLRACVSRLIFPHHARLYES
jgi:hypothetical protein